MKRTSYPLQWPVGWKRAAFRRTPKFQAQFARDRDHVIRQLNRMGGSHVVITSDLPTRNDGLPYANATCNDPGVAVYWVQRGKEMVIACDHWRHVTHNLRAIDKTIDALRGIERWGASTMVERAFAGFAALPSGPEAEAVSPSAKKHWREVLSMLGHVELLSSAEQRAIAKIRHREAIKLAHPDAGGTHEMAAEINAALAEAEEELGA